MAGADDLAAFKGGAAAVALALGFWVTVVLSVHRW